jgi:hypothetical protein
LRARVPRGAGNTAPQDLESHAPHLHPDRPRSELPGAYRSDRERPGPWRPRIHAGGDPGHGEDSCGNRICGLWARTSCWATRISI